MKSSFQRAALATAVAGLCLSSAMLHASSHREAPFITEIPKVDGTDFYMFRSYEPGREDFVTLIANYLPLQAPFGGPNYFDLDDDAIYEIHIDWSGDGNENLTFQFDFSDVNQDLALAIGPDGAPVSTPLKNIGQFGPGASANPDEVTPFMGDDAIATRQEYTLTVIQGDRRQGSRSSAVNVAEGSTTFRKAMDNIGEKSIPNYGDYADTFIHDFSVSNCDSDGRVFVGQRREAFAVSLGEVFDLVNITGGPVVDEEQDGLGRDRGLNDLDNFNVTSIAVEVPTDCLTRPGSVTSEGDPVIGGWTTASVRQVQIINPEPTDKNFNPMTMGQSASVKGGAFTQVSRLGMPLVNEVVIGLKDKDRFNHSEPNGDGQFLNYVTHPTLPVLLNVLFGVEVPDTPRNDLVQVFLTGIPGANQPVDGSPAEMLRLNTAVAPTPFAEQNDFGFIDGDLAGFPNGRRPVDDVVDIALNVVIGELTGDNSTFRITDGAVVNRAPLLNRFPYLGTPIAGSPFGASNGN